MANTTADKLNLLKQTKADIKTALANKGQTVDDTTPFSDYAEKINNIEDIGEYFPLDYPGTIMSPDGVDSTNALIARLKKCPPLNIPDGSSLRCLFKDCYTLTSIPQINITGVRDTASMFENCVNLTSVPDIDLSNVIACFSMYKNCTSLTSIPQSSLNMSANTDHTSMFENCTALSTPLNVTFAGNSAKNTFKGCSSIPSINFSMKYAQILSSCFEDCTSLTAVDLKDTFSYDRVPTESSSSEITTDMSLCFANCTSLTTVECDSNIIYADDLYNCFSDCSNLTSIPILSTKMVSRYSSGYFKRTFYNCASLETLTIQDMDEYDYVEQDLSYCFSGCTSLTSVSGIALGRASDLRYTFRNCSSLTNDFLNIILGQLPAVGTVNESYDYIGEKTLKYIGLSEEQATTCTTLSNWSSAEAAGWTTGY